MHSPYCTFKVKNIRVEFPPAKCTSKAHPCDLGIIRSFKAHYRNQLLKNTLLSTESGGKKKSVNVLETPYDFFSMGESRQKCISSSFLKGVFPEVRSDEFAKENSNETEEFFPT
ncbi:hypothetical protein AVEN_232154-1 [Araneus ventricosus]|uniref:DDE-1 domain-containing protein n=1 Tax=Araneus ventricosus TaxID=182803 RepID=A0A4Y2FZ27_ARAVE|nr:hypothetical protein AVEN_232154-1 [Araneus ventricosus]